MAVLRLTETRALRNSRRSFVRTAALKALHFGRRILARFRTRLLRRRRFLTRSFHGFLRKGRFGGWNFLDASGLSRRGGLLARSLGFRRSFAEEPAQCG